MDIHYNDCSTFRRFMNEQGLTMNESAKIVWITDVHILGRRLMGGRDIENDPKGKTRKSAGGNLKIYRGARSAIRFRNTWRKSWTKCRRVRCDGHRSWYHDESEWVVIKEVNRRWVRYLCSPGRLFCNPIDSMFYGHVCAINNNTNVTGPSLCREASCYTWKNNPLQSSL